MSTIQSPFEMVLKTNTHRHQFLTYCPMRLTHLALPHPRVGVPQDYKEALKWNKLAGEQGKIKAQYNLGMSYLVGQGVPQDFKEAVKWFRLAAEQGDAFAQFKLGGMYLMGKGVPQDSEAARKWMKLSTDQ